MKSQVFNAVTGICITLFLVTIMFIPFKVAGEADLPWITLLSALAVSTIVYFGCYIIESARESFKKSKEKGGL